MTLAWALLAGLVVLAAFPKSTHWVRVRLFEFTDHLIRNATPLRVLFWIAALAAVVAFAQILTGELAWLAAMDAATFIEVSAAVAIAGAVARVDLYRRAAVLALTRAVRFVRRGLARSRSASRAVRTQRPRKAPPPEEGAFAWA